MSANCKTYDYNPYYYSLAASVRGNINVIGSPNEKWLTGGEAFSGDRRDSCVESAIQI